MNKFVVFGWLVELFDDLFVVSLNKMFKLKFFE